MLATGDQFIADEQVRARPAEDAHLADTEGYALAATAQRFGLPIWLVEHVSDGAWEGRAQLAGVGGRLRQDPRPVGRDNL